MSNESAQRMQYNKLSSLALTKGNKMHGATAERIKFYPRLKIFKNSTGNVTFDPKKVEALSYNWWVFVKKIKGKVVFNDYRYSNTTSAHQYLVRTVLKDLGIKIDVEVSIADSLSEEGLNHAQKTILSSIAENQVHLENPKRKKANDDGFKGANESLWSDFKVLKSLGANVKKSSYKNHLTDARNDEKRRQARLVEDREIKKTITLKAQNLLESSLEPSNNEVSA